VSASGTPPISNTAFDHIQHQIRNQHRRWDTAIAFLKLENILRALEPTRIANTREFVDKSPRKMLGSMLSSDPASVEATTG